MLLTNIAEHTEIIITMKAEGTFRRDKMTLTVKLGQFISSILFSLNEIGRERSSCTSHHVINDG